MFQVYCLLNETKFAKVNEIGKRGGEGDENSGEECRVMHKENE